MVSVELAPALPGETVAGEKAQLMPAGRLEQDSETELLKAPDTGITWIWVLPGRPELTVIDDREVLKRIDELG